MTLGPFYLACYIHAPMVLVTWEVMGAQCDKVKKKWGQKADLRGKKFALTTMGKYDVRVFELGIA